MHTNLTSMQRLTASAAATASNDGEAVSQLLQLTATAETHVASSTKARHSGSCNFTSFGMSCSHGMEPIAAEPGVRLC